MYKPKSRRRRSVFEITEGDTQNLDTMASGGVELTPSVSHDTVDVEPKRDVAVQHTETV